MIIDYSKRLYGDDEIKNMREFFYVLFFLLSIGIRKANPLMPQQIYLEAISKPRIRSESKAQADEKAQHTRKYVSILKRLATQLSGLRRGFEMASNNFL